MAGMWFFEESGMVELCRRKKPTIKWYARTMPDAFFNYLKLGLLKHYFCHGQGGLVASDRPFDMLVLCQNYAGAMLEFLDPYQKRPRPEEDY